MATTLRLRPEAEEALRIEAARSGQSQQDLIRDAVDQYLGLATQRRPATESELMITTHGVLPARSPYHEVKELLELPVGITTLELLDREERR
jgi:uncharacterized protein